MGFCQSFMVVVPVFVPLLQGHGLSMAQVLQTNGPCPIFDATERSSILLSVFHVDFFIGSILLENSTPILYF